LPDCVFHHTTVLPGLTFAAGATSLLDPLPSCFPVHAATSPVSPTTLATSARRVALWTMMLTVELLPSASPGAGAG
jgi:hypothetical protein